VITLAIFDAGLTVNSRKRETLPLPFVVRLALEAGIGLLPSDLSFWL
jgi:hypothetical protein